MQLILNDFICILILIFLLCCYAKNDKGNICINFEKEFKRHYDLPKSPFHCKKNNKKYTCHLLYNSSKRCDAIIYNGNCNINSKFRQYNYSFNIVMASEKLSQIKHMLYLSTGKDKKVQLAVDYRLFVDSYHLSYPIYSYYNIKRFIAQSRSNYGNLYLFLKRKSVVYLQRASYTNRQYIVKEIMKYIPVDSYGKDLNNRKWPNNIPKKNKIDLYKNYKFCIAIENSIILWKKGSKMVASDINNDYVTEKLTDCLLAGSIPIYFGPKTINMFLPHPNSIINFSNFNSIKNLTDYIKKIINDKKMLELHLQWHSNISKEWLYRFTVNYSFNYCKICDRIIK